MKCPMVVLIAVFFGVGPSPAGAAGAGHTPTDRLLAGQFRWICGPPVLAPLQRPGETCYSVKDTSVVRFEGRWHLFCTIRGKVRSHQIEYISFRDWKDTSGARREILRLSDEYFCAPQVFYFTPQRKWYMILQVIDKSRKPALQPAFSTTAELSDPGSWTAPKLLFDRHPENVSMWIDFWVICDSRNAHLFFTSLDGRMWRSEAGLSDFPFGWSQPAVVLRGDLFEAAHLYRLEGLQKYLAIVEAQAGGRRYYKAYLADRPDGRWEPLADTLSKPFAAPGNVRFIGPTWSDSFSHGELIRAGYDESLRVDAARLRFVFQGVSDEQKRGKPYGQIPWRLGLLEPAP